jgi:hypothetical protein
VQVPQAEMLKLRAEKSTQMPSVVPLHEQLPASLASQIFVDTQIPDCPQSAVDWHPTFAVGVHAFPVVHELLQTSPVQHAPMAHERHVWVATQ